MAVGAAAPDWPLLSCGAVGFMGGGREWAGGQAGGFLDRVGFLDWLEAVRKRAVSVRGEEDGAVGGADGAGRRPQDGVAQRRALEEVVVVVGVWVGRGACRPESQVVGGGRRRHGRRHCQRAGQETGTQSFGEILREGQRRLRQRGRREEEQI